MPKYRALVNMSLRRSPDSASSLYEEWHDWQAGEVFEPPPHMNVERALARGIMEVMLEKKEGKGRPDG